MLVAEQLKEFDDQLALFAYRSGLGDIMRDNPESITIKAQNTKFFHKLETAFAAQSRRMAVIERSERFLAVAKLKGRIVLPHFGTIQWVEIVEPEPEEVAYNNEIRAARFLYPDLGKIRTHLMKHQIAHEQNGDGLSIDIDPTGRRLEFTDADAETVMDYQIRTGEAIEVRL